MIYYSLNTDPVQGTVLNSLLRILAVVFGIFLLASLYFSAATIIGLSRTHLGGSQEPVEYHFAVFLPDTSAQFFAQIAEGAREAARETGVGLTFHPIGGSSPDFLMAPYIGVDGIIVYPDFDQDEARRMLDRLQRLDIPVVLIEHALSDQSPWPFVGTNNFDLGRRIGELIPSDPTRSPHIAVVYSAKSPAIRAEKELLEMGIVSTLGSRADLEISRRETGLNPLDAAELAYQILRFEPEITSIIFTDVNDTLAATQVLIDLNLVGSVRIIGFGSEDPIPDYLEKGILAGSIAVNPWKVGFNAVKVLTGLRRDGYSPGYVDTGVEILRGTP